MHITRRLFCFFMTLWVCALGAFALDYVEVSIYNPATQRYTAQQAELVQLVCDQEHLETDAPAFLLDSRTMVPVRVISEQLGATITWHDDTQTVEILLGEDTIFLTIGSPIALVNDQQVPLYDNVAPILVKVEGGSRTMVPLRFISEQLGMTVNWDQESYTALIQTAQETAVDVAAPVFDNHVLTIDTANLVEVNAFSLTDRVIIDLLGGAYFQETSGQFDVQETIFSSVRFNQYDMGYDDYSKVARVVLDMREGFDLEDLDIVISPTEVTISVVTDLGEPPAPEEVVPDPEEEPESLVPSIMLDAGHGGEEISAIHHGVDEKDLNLPITLALGAILEEAGLDVQYTRTEDVTVSLSQRVEMANQAEVDIFVSIHANTFLDKPSVNGIETFYLYGGEAGKALATAVQSSLIAATGATDRGAKEAGYYVIKNTVMPAILVETGFMTNLDELALLLDPAYQQTLAQAMAQGIMDYLKWEVPSQENS